MIVVFNYKHLYIWKFNKFHFFVSIANGKGNKIDSKAKSRWKKLSEWIFRLMSFGERKRILRIKWHSSGIRQVNYESAAIATMEKRLWTVYGISICIVFSCSFSFFKKCCFFRHNLADVKAFHLLSFLFHRLTGFKVKSSSLK